MKKTEKYWMSLEDWKQDGNFKKLASGEFSSPLPSEAEQEGWHRREFLKLMGASVALATFGCVRRPTEKIVPYVKRPDDTPLGKAQFYSSSYYDGEEGFGILVKTREGRPIKIEGNKNHPLNQGALSARAHSHLLSLYDPERLKHPRQNLFNKDKTNKESIRASYEEADSVIVQHLKKGKVAFLTGSEPSPTSHRLMRDFCRAFSCSHYVFHPLSHRALLQAQKLCYGKAAQIPRYRIDRARLVLSINCDFLGTWLYPTDFNRMYSQAKKIHQNQNRLVVFESLLSLTGTNADVRIRIKPSQQLDLVLALISSLISKARLKYPWPSHLARPATRPWEKFSIAPSLWDKLVEDLWNHRGQSLVLAGGAGSQSSQMKSLYVAVEWLNFLLQNDGWTKDYTHPYLTDMHEGPGIESFLSDLENNKIDTVIIHKSNPLYSYPDTKRLTEALRKARLVVYTGDREDETGRFAHYILPDHHPLEKWQDWEFQKGVVSISQPTIRPLYKSRAFEEALVQWAGGGKKTSFLNQSSSWYAYLKKRYGVQEWHHLLQTGVIKRNVKDSESLKPVRSLKPHVLSHIQQPLSQKMRAGEYEMIVYPTSGLKDGTLANVSWLQEFPDPVTKICWDNYVCLSPKEAQALSLKEGQIVTLQGKNNTSVKVPVHIQPGQAEGVVALAMGYGRGRGAGEVASHVGVNAFALAEVSKEGFMVFSALPVTMKATGETVPLASVQGHHSMEGRQIVVETTLKQYLKNPGGAIHRHKMFSLWSEHKYPKHKWAMVIDLNSCTGCSACVTACQSENNTPTVGKDLVLQGREMHWMRIDRYYKGSPTSPKTVHQPVVCQHCDNAPCETVCPVVATVHSDEGTNDMIYNRCVGTRYCANNCPYKVRRFNWFNYEKNIKPPLNMALNPEVTVRSRGVMEKCTFCLHRIRAAQAEAKLDGRPLKDGDVQTACQQSCPAGAIIFGDLKDPHSRVSRHFKREDAYSLLEELNTQPAVRYTVKVRNPLMEQGQGDELHKEDPHGGDGESADGHS